MKKRNLVDDIIISVIAPVYNEEDSILEFHNRLEKVLHQIGKRYEVLYINDGSNDRSKEVLEKIAKDHKNVMLISLRKNSGKSGALSIGFREARGNYIITIDSDLQDYPEEIPRLLDKLEEGFDIVSGWKIDRKDGFSKRISSKFFNWVVSKYSGIYLHDYNCGLKAYCKEAVKTIRIYGQHHRYIMLYLGFAGFKITEIPVRHATRKYGQSKYGISRLFWGYFDFLTGILLTRFISTPLYLFGIFFLGFEAIGISLCFLLIIFQNIFSNLTSLYLILWSISLFFIFTGIIVLGIGLLSELTIFIYHNPRADRILNTHSKYNNSEKGK